MKKQVKNIISEYLRSLISDGFKTFSIEDIKNYIFNYYVENSIDFNELSLNKSIIASIKIIIKECNFIVFSKSPFLFKTSELVETSQYEKSNNYFLKERDLHPYLESFLKYFGLSPKTIMHEKTMTSSFYAWLQPDIVANLNGVIYSFEIKRVITLKNYRISYFQTVSNSSWANYGYLVCNIINTYDSELYNGLCELNKAYGIGVIILDTNEVNKSKILFKSSFRKLDNKFVEKYSKDNVDMSDFKNKK